MIFANINIDKNKVCFVDKSGREITCENAMKKIVTRCRNIFADFELFLLSLASLHIPSHTIRMIIFRSVGIKIASNSVIHMGFKTYNPRGLTIGKDTVIGNDSFLDGRSNLSIGDHVAVASEVLIYNAEHDINDPEFKAINAPVEIGDFVFIGPRAIILPGVKVMKGAIIAAGAVVTKNVDEFSVVAGVPAKKIGERKIRQPNYILGRARLFQ